MSRGRDKFKKYKIIIHIITCIISVFPKKLRQKYFFRLRNRNGNFGLLLRYATLKTLAKSIGDNVSIHPGVYIFNSENLIIGNNVSIHPMCYIEAYGKITIGSDVSIAHGVTILSVNHYYQNYEMLINDQGIESRPTVIENNVWIGAKSSIMGGVTVASGSVIATGAIITKNFKENNVLVGIPAKILKNRGDINEL